MSITREKKQELVQEYALSEGDTGSVEVQCAILTYRIKSLTEHFKENKKDYQSNRGLLVLVYRRRKLLKYLERKDKARRDALVVRLGLRKKS